MGSLVVLGRLDGLNRLLSLGGSSFDGLNPRVAKRNAGSLEDVLLAVDVEKELGGTLFLDISDIGLEYC